MASQYKNHATACGVIFTIPSAGSKLRKTAFCDLRFKSKMVNSNVPHLRSLVSVSCIVIIVQV